MDVDYDVVVAGAGPAGAQCTRDAAARGYDVAVVESEGEDVFPSTSNKSTGGTFPEMMASFGVPDDVVMKFTDKVVLESPNDHFVQEYPGAVLDFADFKRFLVEDGREKGAEYIFGERATEPITEDGKVVGLRHGDGELRAHITVDATGPSAALARQLGVSDLERRNQAIGVEYELEGIELDREGYADLRGAMMLRLDQSIAPGGYSWVFHTGDDTAKVGVCYIQNEEYQKGADDDKTIDDYLQGWIDDDPRFENASRMGERHHRGSAHIQEPGRMSAAGFMAVGDTVPTVDPVWGEGIHKCMKSGRAAAVTADKCLTSGVDTSEEEISQYEDLWHNEVAPRAGSRLLMARLLYLVPNGRYDRLMQDLREADEETLRKANEGDKRAMMKLLHPGDVRTLARYWKGRVTA